MCEEDLGCSTNDDCSAGEICNTGSRACQPRCTVDTQADVPHAQRMIELFGGVWPGMPRRVVNTSEAGVHVSGNQLFAGAEIIAHRTVPDSMAHAADPSRYRELVDDTGGFASRLVRRAFQPGKWAAGTQLREEESGLRYTPTTCFETFPMPWTPGREPLADLNHAAIAAAARDLIEKRPAWLAGTDPAEKKVRTLTALYNKRPQWLIDAHAALDAAVCAAYGWPTDLSDADILSRLLDLNRARSRDEGS